MERSVSAAEAKRRFSGLLRDVRKGHSYVVTTQGRPVAKITPVGESAVSKKAKAVLIERLKSQKPITIPRWRREELYDNE
jgi:prevent-host-death family protein